MNRQISSQDWQNLSDYLDKQLPPKAVIKLEADLKQNPDLKQAMDDLLLSRTLLKRLPRQHAPHNFTLSAASLPSRVPAFPFIPVFSLASAVCTILLLFSLFFQSNLFPAPLQAENLAIQSKAAAPMAAVANPPGPTPEVFAWGGSAPSQPFGRGGGGNGGGEPSDTSPAPALAPPAIPEATPQLPGMTAKIMPTPTIPPIAAVAPAPVENVPLEGSGPILGLRPTSEQGLEYSAEPRLGDKLVNIPPVASPSSPILQIFLAALAVLFALAAVVVGIRYRK